MFLSRQLCGFSILLLGTSVTAYRPATTTVLRQHGSSVCMATPSRGPSFTNRRALLSTLAVAAPLLSSLVVSAEEASKKSPLDNRPLVGEAALAVGRQGVPDCEKRAPQVKALCEESARAAKTSLPYLAGGLFFAASGVGTSINLARRDEIQEAAEE